MKLLLTSAGVKNASIHDALVDLLGNRLPRPTRSVFRPRRTPIPAALVRRGASSTDELPPP